MKFSKLLILLFIINLFLDILFNNVQELYFLRIVSKPLISVILGIFFFFYSKRMRMTNRLKIFGALFCMMIGDILLLENYPTYSFVTGLSFSLAGLVFYAFYFYKEISYDIDRLLPFLAVLLLIVLAFIYFIYDGLQNLLIPVMTYIAVMLNFIKLSYLRYKNVNYQSYLLVFTGTIFFTFAQIIIGLNAFYHSVPEKDVFIMLFYGTGQLLIILGIIKKYKVGIPVSRTGF